MDQTRYLQTLNSSGQQSSSAISGFLPLGSGRSLLSLLVWAVLSKRLTAPVAMSSANSKKLLFFKINVNADGKRASTTTRRGMSLYMIGKLPSPIIDLVGPPLNVRVRVEVRVSITG